MAKQQNTEPVKADAQATGNRMSFSEIKDQTLSGLTLPEIKDLIGACQVKIAEKKTTALSDAVKAAKKAYLALTAQGIAMPVKVFVESLTDLTDDERKVLSSELEGGLKPQEFAEYALLDAIRDELISIAKTCNYKKSGKTSTGSGDRKVKLSNFTCICPICGDVVGNLAGRTQKHLIVNQMRLHMLNKHGIEKDQFNKDYRVLVNDTTIATKDIIEEVR